MNLLTSPEAKRVGEIPEDERPDHLANLPDHAIIASGTLNGHGAVELASDKATISAKVVKLVRTSSGGIDYELAIYVSEPVVVAAPAPVATDPQFEEAVVYLKEHGNLDEEDAREAVKKFGAARILAAKHERLNDELDDLLTGRRVNRALPPTAPVGQPYIPPKG